MKITNSAQSGLPQVSGSTVTVTDSGGGPIPPLTETNLAEIIQELLDLIAAAGGGDFLTVTDGGGGTVFPHGSLGSTETIDTANGNYHWGTLNANCTFTFTTIVDTAERWFTLELIEDGTGGWTVTWPGSVSWLGGTTPTHTTTAGTTTIYAFFTRNGGTTWIGGQLGGGGSALTVENEGTPLATAATTLDFVGPLVTASGAGAEKTITVTGALDDLTDVVITSPVNADTLRYNGTNWFNDARMSRPLMDGSGNVITDSGTGDAIMALA